MSQAGLSIPDLNGAAYRAATNAALLALVTQNAGATEPSPAYPFMCWADTANDRLKIRNAANNAWIEIGVLSAVNLGLLRTNGSLASCTGLPLTTGVTGVLPAANGGNGMIETQDASASALVTFNVDFSVFEELEVTLSGVTPSSDSIFNLIINNDTTVFGAGFGAYYWARSHVSGRTATSGSAGGQGDSARFPLIPSYWSGTDGICGKIRLHKTNGNFTSVIWDLSSPISDGGYSLARISGAGRHQGSALSSLAFKFASGNISTGRFSLAGTPHL